MHPAIWKGSPETKAFHGRGLRKVTTLSPIYCKLGMQLLLITNKKCHINFQLATKLMTLHNNNGQHRDSSFGQYKVCVDICRGSLERTNQSISRWSKTEILSTLRDKAKNYCITKTKIDELE